MRNPRSWCPAFAQLFFVGIILSLTVMTGRAQTFRGTILGTVTDTTGAVVPGATITIRNVNTGLSPDHGKPG